MEKTIIYIVVIGFFIFRNRLTMRLSLRKDAIQKTYS